MSRLALLVLALPLFACSAILHPENYPINCDGVGASDTCIPFGMMCVDHICVPIVPVDGGPPPDGCGGQESCNGIDDNCNGLVDEDPASDMDHDSFTFCGTVSPTMNHALDPARVDCNDSDPSVYPGAPEICDGKDNNCNGMVDEANPMLCLDGEQCSAIAHACFVPGDCTNPDPSQQCATGSMCDTSTSPPHCVTGDCTMTGSAPCPGAQRCNPVTHACVMPAVNGTPCAGDTDCASGLCFDTSSLVLPPSGPTGSVCGQACCADTDCGAGEICWAPGNGARSCLPRALVGRTVAGNGVSGASCSGASDCRSGFCDSGGLGCVGPCGSDSECMGLTCALSSPISVPGSGSHHVLSCVTASGGHPGDACCQDSECASGICLDAYPPGSGCFVMGECSTACRTTADCPAHSFDFGTGYCTYGHTADTMDALQVCFYRYMSGGAGVTGASCSRASDCRDGDCEGGTCHDACCTDGDCTGGTRCRPGTGSFPSMRCR